MSETSSRKICSAADLKALYDEVVFKLQPGCIVTVEKCLTYGYDILDKLVESELIKIGVWFRSSYFVSHCQIDEIDDGIARLHSQVQEKIDYADFLKVRRMSGAAIN